MKQNALSGDLNDGADPIGLKLKEYPFDDASRALRKALDALNVLELTQTIQPPDFEPGINFYAEVRRFEIGLIRYALSKTGGQTDSRGFVARYEHNDAQLQDKGLSNQPERFRYSRGLILSRSQVLTLVAGSSKDGKSLHRLLLFQTD
jgi:hypothetical protein